MAKDTLNGLKVAILATDGFEQSELTEPRKALDEAGADTEIISPKKGKVRGWKMKEWGDEVSVDQALDEADPKDYDALVLPGGVINADALRMQPKAVEVREGLLRCGQAGRRDLSRALGVDRIGRRARPQDDLLALAQDRSDQCGRSMGR